MFNYPEKRDEVCSLHLLEHNPQIEQVEEGKTYAWCTCGKSATQPWCNGAHVGSGFTPKVFQAEENKTEAFCMCKQTKNPPYCDGSHISL